ncbi:MAG: hypothetical protein JSU82_04255 [Rhodospirillales bacterium]|nr:MAG: hypothetical protein JSU82_04255 [Rhodospirillales bacterium]
MGLNDAAQSGRDFGDAHSGGMKIQKLYAAAGLVWGLVLGPDAGLYAARVMGSVAWLYQFENGAWADWVIIPFGAIIGLTVLFSCYQLGSAAGHRYDEATSKRLKHAKSVPWAVLIVGVAVGVMTTLTIEDRQRAVVRYVEAQRQAAARLLALSDRLHRITGYRVEWPGGGEPGRIDLSFRGRRKGDYRFEWKILSQGGTEPLLGGGYNVRLGEAYKTTSLSFSATDLANAYVLQMKTPGRIVAVDERFRLLLELRPLLAAKDWAALPEDEPVRLDEGESILLKRAETSFAVRFEARGGRVVW